MCGRRRRGAGSAEIVASVAEHFQPVAQAQSVAVASTVGQRHVHLNEQHPSPPSSPSHIPSSLLFSVRRLQLRFDFDSTGVGRAFDCLSEVIEVTVT